MKNNLDELLKKALVPMDVPDRQLNQQVLLAVKERKSMKNQRKVPAVAAAVICVVLLGSITVAAAHRYLSTSEVAVEIEDNTLKNAFLSENAVLVNETQESGGYYITLLGSVAGKNISDYLSTDGQGIPKDNKIYTVVAIEHADGTPMTPTSSDDYGKEPFYVSCYIRGLDPNKYSLMSMNGAYTAFVKDGIEYRVLSMDNIEIFADKGIYVGASTGSFYDRQAYNYDESTGIMSRNENYAGVNALFELPMDKSKGDPAAAQAYLEKLEEQWNTPDEPLELMDEDKAVEEFMQKLTPENLDEYAQPIESTRATYTPDKGGIVNCTYELESGDPGGMMKQIMPEDVVGRYMIDGYSYSNGLEDLRIDVTVLNEDGTVTYVLYQPKGNS